MGFWDWLWKKDDDGLAAHVTSVRPPPMPLPRIPPVPSATPAAPSMPPAGYGIESAIELMRSLPLDDDPDLVLRVVRKTLRSTGVSVEEVIASAKSRENALAARAAEDRAAIEQLEREIETRKENIGRIDSELEETRNVRQNLENAIENETKIGPVVPPGNIELLQAEAAAGAARRAAVGAPAKAASMPPLPKGGKPAQIGVPSVPPNSPRSFAPKLNKSVKPEPMPSAAAKPTGAVDDALPVLSDAVDTSSETTERYDVGEADEVAAVAKE
jgi:hypothetical protein